MVSELEGFMDISLLSTVYTQVEKSSISHCFLVLMKSVEMAD